MAGYDRAMSDDPFPRERVGTMVRRMPAYLKLAWRLAKEPLLSKARRAAVVAAAGYLASPVDLVPGVIPVLGQLDDIAVALAALRIALAGLDPERRRAHLEAVGLGDEDLTADLRTVGATTAWIGRAGYRTTKRAAVAGGRAAGSAARTTRSAVDRATPAARATASRAAPAARATGRAAVGAAGVVASAGGTAVRAAGAAFAKMPRTASRPSGLLRVRRVELPLLPPPAPEGTPD
jgi:uncharacterized membrane protein YkvA (DUF1232 family)